MRVLCRYELSKRRLHLIFSTGPRGSDKGDEQQGNGNSRCPPHGENSELPTALTYAKRPPLRTGDGAPMLRFSEHVDGRQLGLRSPVSRAPARSSATAASQRSLRGG